MRITVWMSERSLDQFNRGDKIDGMLFFREPGHHIDVRQVSITYDEYYKLQDQRTSPVTKTDAVGEEYQAKLFPNLNIAASLPEGAEWDVKYSLEESTHSMHDIKLYTFADVYDITRATPNNMQLGELIRNMVNDSDE